MKCGFKQVFVADAGTWEQNLNSPIDHSDGGEAGGGAVQLTRKDGRTPPRHDESARGGAWDVHTDPDPTMNPNHARLEKVSVIVWF